MEIGVREAKADLSKLIKAALNGEKVVITNHGRPLVRLVPEPPKPIDPRRGIGSLKQLLADLPPDWDSIEQSERVADLFDHVRDLKAKGQYRTGGK